MKTQHPLNFTDMLAWERWRRIFCGGDQFVDNYLLQYSERETVLEFEKRKQLTYCPSFAKSAVIDVKNAIFQRLAEVTRTGGDPTYQESIKGENGGVNNENDTMDSFIGRIVLPELLFMGKVAVFIDKPAKKGPTLADNVGLKPYLYIFKREDIINWTKDKTGKYTSILLRARVPVIDVDTGLPTGFETEYRLFKMVEEAVVVTIYDEDDAVKGQPITLELKQLPVAVFELSDSLLKDVDKYQVALLNMNSSDIDYIVKANYPFYVEEHDFRLESEFLKPTGGATSGEVAEKQNERVIGPAKGRLYPKGTNPPQYIHPSSEPLTASMAKEEQIKREIRELININLASLYPKGASAESKIMDERGLESGLSYIGLELENGERQIASIWCEYQNVDNDVIVTYPKRYSLKSDDQKLTECKNLLDIRDKIPSKTAREILTKKAVSVLLTSDLSSEDKAKILKEIESAEVLIVDNETLALDVERGILDPETASKARLYPEGTYEKAKLAHAERLALIQKAQTSVQGDQDISPNDQTKQKELTQDPDSNPVPKKKTRGTAL